MRLGGGGWHTKEAWDGFALIALAARRMREQQRRVGQWASSGACASKPTQPLRAVNAAPLVPHLTTPRPETVPMYPGAHVVLPRFSADRVHPAALAQAETSLVYPNGRVQASGSSAKRGTKQSGVSQLQPGRNTRRRDHRGGDYNRS